MTAGELFWAIVTYLTLVQILFKLNSILEELKK